MGDMAEVSQKKRIWGWWFFDWASQPYHTLLVTFVFGPFFAAVAAQHFLGQGLAEEAAKAEGVSKVLCADNDAYEHQLAENIAEAPSSAPVGAAVASAPEMNKEDDSAVSALEARLDNLRR